MDTEDFPNISGIEDLKPEQLKALDLQTDYENDYTQKEVAEKVDRVPRTIRNWEKDPTYKSVKKTLSLLRMPMDKVDKAMVKEAEQGNTAAARLLYKRAGLIDGEKSVINIEQKQAQSSDNQSQKETIDLSEQIENDPEVRKAFRTIRKKQQNANQ